jgi:hypothetical protein
MTDPLDAAEAVALDDQAPWFDWMTEAWPDRATARHCLRYVHLRDVERAAQPPVIHVTVPGIPGHFTGTAGGSEVAYEPVPAPEAGGLSCIAPEMTGGFAVVPDSPA